MSQRQRKNKQKKQINPNQVPVMLVHMEIMHRQVIQIITATANTDHNHTMIVMDIINGNNMVLDIVDTINGVAMEVVATIKNCFRLQTFLPYV